MSFPYHHFPNHEIRVTCTDSWFCESIVNDVYPAQKIQENHLLPFMQLWSISGQTMKTFGQVHHFLLHYCHFRAFLNRHHYMTSWHPHTKGTNLRKPAPCCRNPMENPAPAPLCQPANSNHPNQHLTNCYYDDVYRTLRLGLEILTSLC